MENKICILTPDGADRPEFLKHCCYQASRQTVKAKHIVLSRKPTPGKPDLTAKIRAGALMAYEQGFKYCAVMENDDYYPDNYIETILNWDFDLWGIAQTIYYNIALRKYQYFAPEGRSSLFMTAFRTEFILDYPWPADTEVYLDLHLWSHYNLQFNEQSLTANTVLLPPDQVTETPIGIKHGIGYCGGNGHHDSEMYLNSDPNLQWFNTNMHRKESRAFYADIMQQIKYNQLDLIRG